MKARGLLYALVFTLCVGAAWANGQETIYISQDGYCGGYTPCYSTIQEGIDSASLPSVIKISQETYYEDIVLDINQMIDFDGGWDTSFTSCSSQTTISGSITISDGTMIIGGTGKIIVSIPPPTISSFSANPTSINFGESSTLSWSLKNAASASINQGVGSINPSTGSVDVNPATTTTYTLTATNAMGTNTAQATVTVIPILPTINSFSVNPDTIDSGQSSTLSWSITNATSASIDQGIGSVDPTSGSTNVSPSTTTTYTLTATNASGFITAQITLTVNAAGPPAIVSFTGNPGTINPGESSTLSWNITNASSASIDMGVGSVNPAAGSTSVSPPSNITYTLTATSGAGPSTAQVTVIVSGTLPPDPSTVAPPVDRTVSTDMNTATSFLYRGYPPIQTGVAPGAIEPKRSAVLRGKVLDRNNDPLPGVTITILNHPEYGQTLSRTDGMFDLVVNGGGYLTVNYSKTNHLPAQRQFNVPWQDSVLAPEVILIALDTAVTPIDLTKPDPIQVARGSIVTDNAGARQATVLIPSGTTAALMNADGTTQTITSMNVRATEYSVGDNGPKAMPAELPPTSGYTYCVEVSADEAISAGAQSVEFSQPLVYYVENYLNGAIGSIVPVGYYDRVKGLWIPSENGRVVKVISISGDPAAAEVDTDGDGIADSGLGITDAERQRLASIYTAGQELWRVPISHFTPWDCNWPYGPPPDATSPNQKPPDQKKKGDCEDEEGGSIIGCQSQTLGEAVDIVGTRFSLHYQSDRVPGQKAAYTLEIPLSGGTVPDSLVGIVLEIYIAGRKFTHSLSRGTSCLQTCPNLGGGGTACVPPTPGNDTLTNQTFTFTWDGVDAYGRTLQGQQPIRVRIGYSYCGVYMEPAQLQKSFAALSGVSITGSSSLNQFTFWQEWNGMISTWDARGQRLGGWTLNVHHAYEPLGMRLYLGNGDQRSAEDLGLVINKVAGSGLYVPTNLAVSPDGSLYIADTGNSRVRRVGPDGIITTVAGTGVYGYSGDGGPAINAELSSPRGIATGPDGSLYIADVWNKRIRRVGPDGIITTVAGTGVGGYGGDGGPAINAQLYGPIGVAIGPDGSLYIAENVNNRIRRVGPDGIITTVAGTGVYGCSGDGGPAKNARLDSPVDVAVGPDGSFYIADSWNHRIRRVGPDGIITTVAGTGVAGYSGDGGPALNATFYLPVSVTVGPDGGLYIGDYWNYRVRWVGPDGIITTVAGAGVAGYSGDNGPARSATLQCPDGLAVGPDGSLFISDCTNYRVRQVKMVFPEAAFLDDITLPSEDGSQIYIFDSLGKHLRTINSLTGSILYQFGYDAAGHLTTVTDGDGNVTTIERDADSNPTRIIAPFGQATTLSLNSNSYLSSFANPAGETYQFTYTDDGLLTALTDPRGFIYNFTYDGLGLLTKDEDPAGGSKTLTRTKMADGYEVLVTTGMNRTRRYLLEKLPAGDEHRVNTLTDGLKTDMLRKTDGTTMSTFPDGTTIKTTLGPDPRFAMQVPVLKSQTISMPSGLTATTTAARTATLSNPDDPLTLISLKDELTINGRKYATDYTASTRTVSETSPAGRQVSYKIDAQGRLVEHQIAGFSPVRFTYDTQGRLASAAQGAGGDLREFTYQYNAQGFLQAVTDPLLQTISFEYDQAGKVTREVLPDSREIIFTYDSSGNMSSLAPPGRPAHPFTYTPVDLMAEYIPPDIGIGTVKTKYSYNTDRQLTQVLRPDGVAIDFGYDTGARLSTVTYPGGPVTYTYDPITGYLTQVNGPDGNGISYMYDGNLAQSETWAGAVMGSVSRTYDSNFRITGISINAGNTTAYLYDNDSLITKAGDLTLTRSAQNGFLTGSILGNVTDAWTYNSFGEPASYVAKYDNTEIFKQQFTYDKLGRIGQKVETVEGTTNTYDYIYDPAGRLTEVKKNALTMSTYTYDSNDNRVSYTGAQGSINGTYDNQDRLTQYETTTHTYTANGELQSKTAGGQTTLYNYDVFGNLKSVTLPNSTLIEYVVDGQNRRLGKKVNGAWVQKFVYLDQLRPVAELDASEAIVSLFVYGGPLNVPDYMIKGGVTYRIISDHLGSPRLIIDTATGTVIGRMDYDEFGNVLQDTNPGFQPFGFAGGLYDLDTRLVRFGARDYDAEVGRWTAKDPILFHGGYTNLYGYLLNDPVNYVDPSGLEHPAGKVLPKLIPINWPIPKWGSIPLTIISPVWIGPVALYCHAWYEVKSLMHLPEIERAINQAKHAPLKVR